MNTSRNITAMCRFVVCLVLALALGRGLAMAQPSANPPGLMSYQGFLVDNNGFPLATNAPKNYNIIFRIYASMTGDTNSPLWAEQQIVTVDKGYFSVLLGQGSPVGSQPNTNNLAGLFTGATASDRYIGLVVQGLAAGGDVEIAPRLRLLASPYSYLSSYANSIVNSSGVGLLNTFGTFVGINKGGANPASALDVNGTVTATSFSGGGASLTALNAANIATGILPDGRLSSNIPLLNGSQTFSGTPSFNNMNVVSATHTGTLSMSGASATINFGTTLGTKLTLWSPGYTFGMQNSTLYSRSDSQFAWFVGGTHNDGAGNAGSGGVNVMTVANGSLTVNGNIISPRFKVTNVIPYGSTTYPGYGVLPRSGAFTTAGGYLDIFVTCTAYASGTGTRYIQVSMDGSPIGFMQLYFNQASVHTTLPPIHIFTRLSAGTHTLSMEKYTSDILYDQNDVSSAIVTEYPF